MTRGNGVRVALLLAALAVLVPEASTGAIDRVGAAACQTPPLRHGRWRVLIA